MKIIIILFILYMILTTTLLIYGGIVDWNYHFPKRYKKKKIKTGWNKIGEPYWGYSYDEDVDYKHEICFYRLYICW